MISRRTLLGALGTSALTPEVLAAPGAVLWDDGGHRPCRKPMGWCIERFPGLSDFERSYFLREWEKYRFLEDGYPDHPLVSTIEPGDEWLAQYFGDGILVRNVIAEPQYWNPRLSRKAITLRLERGGYVHEVMRPQVCGNGSHRKRRFHSPQCIPPENKHHARSITSVL